LPSCSIRLIRVILVLGSPEIMASPMYWPPNNAERIKLRKGEKITLRYRVLIHIGDHKTADIAGLFVKYISE